MLVVFQRSALSQVVQGALKNRAVDGVCDAGAGATGGLQCVKQAVGRPYAWDDAYGCGQKVAEASCAACRTQWFFSCRGVSVVCACRRQKRCCVTGGAIHSLPMALFMALLKK